MSARATSIAGRVVALVLAVVWGFFVAFNVVFSDVFGIEEMLQALLYVVVAYAVLGVAFGAAGPHTGLRWTWWLTPPGVLFVVSGLFDNVTRMLYHAAVIVALVGGTAVGAWVGAWLRGRFSARRATP